MAWKDIAQFAGVVVALLLGIYNIVGNRRTAFINTVTSERVKWIGKLRENISSYVGLTHYWFMSPRDSDPQRFEDILRDLRILRYHITLQLNPNPEAAIDQRIMQLVREIPDIASRPDVIALLDSLDLLASEGQQLLKAEWDKVKSEAQRGALANTVTFLDRLTMAKRLWIVGALALGIGIGAVGPHLWFHHLDTSWRSLQTDSNNFGISYATSTIFSDLPMADIKSVSGKAKFIEDVGSGGTTEFGYIINVNMAPLDMSKVPQRYKMEKKTLVEGLETTTAPTDRAYYEIQFDFYLKDKDGFILKTLHSQGLPSLVSGTDNLFQAKVGERVDYKTAAETRDILVRPSIVKCHTCEPPAADSSRPAGQATGTKPPAECATAKSATECADILKRLGKNPFEAFGTVGNEPVYGRTQ